MEQQPPSGPERLHYKVLTISLRHTTLDRNPLDEWSAHCRDIHLTRHTHKRQKTMPPAGFVPAIPASEPPYPHALDRAATGKDY